MTEYLIQDTTLNQIADTIRKKTKKTSDMTAAQMADEIESIAVAGTLQTKTVSPTYETQQVTYDNGHTGLSSVTVNGIPSNWIPLPETIRAGDYPIYGMTTSSKINSSDFTDLGVYNFKVNRAGTYRVKYAMMKPAVGGTPTSAVFLNDTQIYTNNSFSDNMQYCSVDVTANAGDTIYVKGKYSGWSYSGYIFGVHICIDWNNPNAFFN